jgi:hypothetical protein
MVDQVEQEHLMVLRGEVVEVVPVLALMAILAL